MKIQCNIETRIGAHKSNYFYCPPSTQKMAAAQTVFIAEMRSYF